MDSMHSTLSMSRLRCTSLRGAFYDDEKLSKLYRYFIHDPARTGGSLQGYLLDSVDSPLERFDTSAGNPIKEILLKLNLSDHRSILTDSKCRSIKVKEFQRSFCHSDTERLSRSDKVLKLKNFKKDATLKLFKSTNQKRFLALGWLLKEIHVTWAHLENKRRRLQTYTKSLKDLCKQWLEMVSQA
ncbi:hypothetical protein Tco_0734183 [Tanacetum coccineum]